MNSPATVPPVEIDERPARVWNGWLGVGLLVLLSAAIVAAFVASERGPGEPDGVLVAVGIVLFIPWGVIAAVITVINPGETRCSSSSAATSAPPAAPA